MEKKREFENMEISLLEVLVKTSYLTQTTHPKDKECKNILSFGSGFIVEYENEPFFVTADHTLHIDDYENIKPLRTWNEYVVSIFNNLTPKDNPLSTMITPLGGFYYMEQFNLSKPKDADELVDITVCKLKEINLEYPFLTDKVVFTNETIEAGENKIRLKKESFSKPNSNTNYLVFGSLAELEGIQLKRTHTLKEDLKYITKSGDYYLFNTSKKITDSKEWEGLSGSPVISEDGNCIGVLCAINENSHSVWVMPIDKVEMLIQVAILQEKLEAEKE